MLKLSCDCAEEENRVQPRKLQRKNCESLKTSAGLYEGELSEPKELHHFNTYRQMYHCALCLPSTSCTCSRATAKPMVCGAFSAVIPMANSSIPASFRLCAGGMTSSWDFPSVMRIPILGTPGLEPDSGLKLFSRTKVRARPGRIQTKTKRKHEDAEIKIRRGAI